jgi:hypothetical protein
VGSSWEYRSLKPGSFGGQSLYFGDLVTFEAEQVRIASPARAYLPISTNRVDSSLRYYLIADSLLVVEQWQKEEAVGQDTLWRQAVTGTDSKQLLAKLVGYELLLPTMKDSIRCRVMPCYSSKENELVYQLIAVDADSMKANVSGTSKGGRGEVFFIPRVAHRTSLQVFDLSTPQKNYPVWTFDFVNDSTSCGMVISTIEESSPETHYVQARMERNDQMSHLTKDELYYLLSQGRISFGPSADFTSSIIVSYQDEAKFIEKGLDFDQLEAVGFSFNSDGSFDVFHQDRNFKNGTYQISEDCAYLILNYEGRCEYRRLYSDGPDHLAFRWIFKIRTPKPLGEVMTSYYYLNTVVNFTAIK